MFDLWIGKKKFPKLSEVLGRPLPVIGYTVAQEEYDVVYKWFQEKQDELARIRELLEPFESTGPDSGGEADSTIRLARNANSLLKASTATIKRQAMENEQLLDQLDQERQEHQAEVKRLNDLIAAQATVKAKRSTARKTS